MPATKVRVNGSLDQIDEGRLTGTVIVIGGPPDERIPFTNEVEVVGTVSPGNPINFLLITVTDANGVVRKKVATDVSAGHI